MKRAALASGVCLLAGGASAHISAGALGGASLWNYDPWLAIPLYLGGLVYWRGTRKLWRVAGFGRGVGLKQSAAYWTAWSILALAFLSPLHWLGERLFAAHMAEHELLLLVAAPLFAYARPGYAALWALPQAWRRPVGGLGLSKAGRAVAQTLSAPTLMTAQNALVLYVWHIPFFYQGALRDEFAHRLEHISFFVSTYLFWRAALPRAALGAHARAREAIAVGCLFLTLMHSGLLGALLTLSPRLWYPEQERLAEDFGLTPLEDQQLAGVIMWIPMSLVYTAAALWLCARLLSRASCADRGETGSNSLPARRFR